MNPVQFLSLVNLGGLVILILLDVVMTIGWVVGGSSVEFRGVPSGTVMQVLPPSLGLIIIVPIYPVFVSIGCTSSP